MSKELYFNCYLGHIIVSDFSDFKFVGKVNKNQIQFTKLTVKIKWKKFDGSNIKATMVGHDLNSQNLESFEKLGIYYVVLR